MFESAAGAIGALALRLAACFEGTGAIQSTRGMAAAGAASVRAGAVLGVLLNRLIREKVATCSQFSILLIFE